MTAAAPLLTDRPAVAAGLDAAAEALVALLRGPAAGAGDVPVRCTGWTVGETAAHVVTVVRRALGDRRRSASPEATAALNAQCLAELTERDPRGLADLLEADVAVVTGHVLPRIPDDDLPVDFHGGTTVRLLTAFGIMLAEVVVHGWDVAHAVGVPFEVTDATAVPGLQAFWEVMPLWADPGHTQHAEVLVDVGAGHPYRLRAAPGTLTAGPAPAGVDAARVAAVDLLPALCGRPVVIPALPAAPVAALVASLRPL